MKTTFLPFVLLMAIAGCATTANYEKILQSWVGASELDLVRQWGPPQQSYETGGVKFLAFTSTRNVFIPGTAPTYRTQMIGNTAYTTQTAGTPAQNYGYSCKTTFELEGGKVKTWKWEGNDCKARE